MYALLDRALKTIIEKGTLRVTGPDGRTREYGDGTGMPVNITVKTPLAAAKIASDADLYLGECYMDGTFDVSGGTTIYDALAILLENAQAHNWPKIAKAANAVRIAMKRVDQYNPVGKAKNNVAHHYDLSGALYAPEFRALLVADLHLEKGTSLARRGVHLPPSQFEAWFLSLAHDEAVVDRTIEAAAIAFRAAKG